ncbi:MAG: hypothetical protein J0H68_01510 [Sphingobacteriia bacterium]|nr:hypothetical protein [Sphingobacteriia bacterium]
MATEVNEENRDDESSKKASVPSFFRKAFKFIKSDTFLRGVFILAAIGFLMFGILTASPIIVPLAIGVGTSVIAAAVGSYIGYRKYEKLRGLDKVIKGGEKIKDTIELEKIVNEPLKENNPTKFNNFLKNTTNKHLKDLSGKVNKTTMQKLLFTDKEIGDVRSKFPPRRFDDIFDKIIKRLKLDKDKKDDFGYHMSKVAKKDLKEYYINLVPLVAESFIHALNPGTLILKAATCAYTVHSTTQARYDYYNAKTSASYLSAQMVEKQLKEYFEGKALTEDEKSAIAEKFEHGYLKTALNKRMFILVKERLEEIKQETLKSNPNISESDLEAKVNKQFEDEMKKEGVAQALKQKAVEKYIDYLKNVKARKINSFFKHDMIEGNQVNDQYFENMKKKVQAENQSLSSLQNSQANWANKGDIRHQRSQHRGGGISTS